MGALVILGGGGGAEQNIECDKYFIRQLGGRKNMLYIPIAMDEHIYTYQQCYDWIKSIFLPMGLSNIGMFADLRSIDFDIIDRYSSVFIGGGNTFYLLDEIRKSKFDKRLKIFIENGGIVYGGSAGAIILGNDIDTASHEDPNDVMLKDLKGLDLVGGYSVWCHYHQRFDQLIKDYVKKSGQKVIAIPEASGISYNLDIFENIGSESCYIFSAFQDKYEVEVGKKF